ncbi:MAG: T9SS type A sorting domain-containing protein [Bacteroidia bacterium]|nr:T9SS type A sorting domain-containing protein [Bacteroidia bacterium]
MPNDSDTFNTIKFVANTLFPNCKVLLFGSRAKQVFFYCIFLLNNFFFLSFCQQNLFAQYSDRLIYNHEMTVPVIEMPFIDTKKLLAEDIENSKEHGFPLKFGYMFDTNISLIGHGQKITLSDSSQAEILKIKSADAFSINLIFNNFYLPEGSELFIFSEDKSMVLGPFTTRNNRSSRRFSTGLVKGDVIILEYHEPLNVLSHGTINISGVVHGYRNSFEQNNRLGDCYIDINCPLGAEWQTDKRAVARLAMSIYWCSGALVNNTRQDGRQFFLTANHCWEANETVEDWQFYFNYEADDCGGYATSFNSVAGAVLLARNPASDFCLVEITEDIPSSEQPYFAGWSNIDEPSDSSACIHHPAGSTKKISLNYDSVVSATWGSPAGNHWMVIDWDTSSTEGGSSGSPLFNKNHNIIGQLHGGNALCENDLDDNFGKFSLSWDYGGSASSRLKEWLDPDNSGIQTIHGYDPESPTLSSDAQLFEIIYPSASYCTGCYDIPAVVIRNTGAQELSSLEANLLFNNEQLFTQIWSGSLLYNEIDTVFFPPVSFPAGTSQIKAWISLQNGLPDEFRYNDTLNQAVTGVQGQLFLLDILGRKYYEDEITWSIKNSLNQVIYSGGPYSTPYPYVQLHIAEQFCLTSGCYSFTIQDNNCGGTVPGSYIFINATTGDTIGSGCHTGIAETIPFCADSCSQAPVIYGPDTVYVPDTVIYTVFYNPGSVYNWLVTGGTVISAPAFDTILISWDSAGFGTVSVSETNIYGCTSISNEFPVILLWATRFNQKNKAKEFLLYPNPACDKIILSINTLEENFILDFYTIQGRKIKSDILLKNTNTIDISELCSGFYILNLNGETINRKIILMILR